VISEKKARGLELEELALINKYLTKFAIELKKQGKTSLEIEKNISQERERIFKDIEFMESIEHQIDVRKVLKRHSEELGIPFRDSSDFSDVNINNTNSQLVGINTALSKIVNFYYLLIDALHLNQNYAWNGFTIFILFITYFWFISYTVTNNFYYVFMLGATQNILFYYIQRNPHVIKNRSFMFLMSILFGIVEFLLFFVCLTAIYNYKTVFNSYYGIFYTLKIFTPLVILKFLTLWMFFLWISNLYLLLNLLYLFIKNKNTSESITKEGYFSIILSINILFTLLVAFSEPLEISRMLLLFFAVYGLLVYLIPNYHVHNNRYEAIPSSDIVMNSQSYLSNPIIETKENIYTKRSKSQVSHPLLASILQVDPNYVSHVKVRINHSKLSRHLKKPIKYYVLSLLTILSIISSALLLFSSYQHYYFLSSLFYSEDIIATVTRDSIFLSICLLFIWLLYSRSVNSRIKKVSYVLTQLMMFDGKSISLSSIKLPMQLTIQEYSDILNKLVMDNIVYLEMDSLRRSF